MFYVSIHTSYVDVNKLFCDILYLEINKSAEIISSNIIPKIINRKLNFLFIFTTNVYIETVFSKFQ